MSLNPSNTVPALRRDRCAGFVFKRLIATGGMGDLFLATRENSDERVVVKKIRADHVGRKDVVTLFEREITLNARLEHENIVRVLEVGEDSDGPFMVMEYLDGRDLSEVLRLSPGPVPLDAAVYMTQQVLAALEHAHNRSGADGQPMGIVHRDVSPSNVFLTRCGGVKLLDFGIAKLEVATPTTQGAAPKGKGAYMAPEQCRNQPVDARADLFSLGSVLYELTTCERAFPGDNVMATLNAILSEEIVPPSQLVEGYPQRLERIVLRALALDPADRFQSAAQMWAALDRVVAEEGWSSAPETIRALHLDLDRSEVDGNERVDPPRRGSSKRGMIGETPSVRRPSSTTSPRQRSRVQPFEPLAGQPVTLARALLGGAVVGVGLTLAFAAGALGRPSVTPPALTVARSQALELRPAVLRWSGPLEMTEAYANSPCREYRAKIQQAGGDPQTRQALLDEPVPIEPGSAEQASDCLGLSELRASLVRANRPRRSSKPKAPQALAVGPEPSSDATATVADPPREAPPQPKATTPIEPEATTLRPGLDDLLPPSR